MARLVDENGIEYLRCTCGNDYPLNQWMGSKCIKCGRILVLTSSSNIDNNDYICSACGSTLNTSAKCKVCEPCKYNLDRGEDPGPDCTGPTFKMSPCGSMSMDEYDTMNTCACCNSCKQRCFEKI